MRAWIPMLWIALAVPAVAGKAERSLKLTVKATEAFNNGQHSKAERLANKALAANPDNTSALFVRVQGNLRLLGLAVEILDKAEGDTSALQALTQVLAGAVVDDARRIVSLEPSSVEAGISRQVLASLVVDPGKVVMELPAPACSDEAIALHAQGERAFADHNMLLAQQRYAEAVGKCDSAATWWVHYGDAAHGLNRPAEAIERYAQAIEREPCHWQAHRFSGDVKLSLNAEPTEVVVHFLTAAACNPTYDPVWGNLSDVGGGPVAPIGRQVDPQGFAALHVEPGSPGSALERTRASVEEVLSAGAPDTPLWAELRRAKGVDLLDAAIFVHLMDADLVRQFPAWRQVNFESVMAYLQGYVLLQVE